jgi:predicted RNase H-like HicB family nuclease
MVLSRSENGDGPEWIATVEELPGCEAHGPTPEGAAAAVAGAVEAWVRQAEADGRDVPPPGAADGHSGRLLVRMPRSLHGELVRASEREGTSLNAYIVAALASSVAWRRGGPEAPGPRTASNVLSRALAVNVAVLVLVALVALALLIAAWVG